MSNKSIKNISVSSMLCAGMVLSSSAIASSLEASLSDEAARIQYEGGFESNELNLGVDYLHHEDNGDLAGVSLYTSGDSLGNIDSLKTAIGAKFVYLDVNDSDLSGGALALGGFVKHNLAAVNLVSIRADLFYAPNVVSFGDADGFLEMSVRAEYQLMENADVFLGVKKIEMDFEGIGEADIDDSIFLGIGINF